MTNTEIDHGARAHSHIVGGSSAARVVACPASVKDILELPEVDTSSPAAERGTALHEAMEFFLGAEEAPETLIELGGMVFNKHEIDDDLMYDALIPALEAFDAYSDLCKHEGGLEFELETRVEITHMPVENVFGTADIIGRTSRRTVIWDWKFGHKPVKPYENKQGLFYGAGALCTMPDMFGPEGDDAPDDWQVDIIICQPGTKGEDGLCYTRWTTNVGRLLDFADELEAAVKEAMEGEDPQRRRGDHCHWCQKKPSCPAHIAPMAGIAQLGDQLRASEAVADAAVADNYPTEAIEDVEHEAGRLSGMRMEMALRAEEWAKAVKTETRERLDRGLPVHGFKLAKGTARRTAFSDEEAAVKVLRRAKIHKADMYKQTLISPAQAEKLMERNKFEMPKKLAEDFAAVSPAKESAPSIVWAEDNREEYVSAEARVAQLAEALSDKKNT